MKKNSNPARGIRLTALALAMSIAGIAHANSHDNTRLAGSTDRLIVKYKDGTRSVGKTGLISVSKLAKATAQTGERLQLLRKTALGSQVLKLNREMKLAEVAQLAARIAQDPDVEYAQPDYRQKPYLTPNDTRYSSQWHYFESAAGINAPLAWDITRGAGAIVAVLDTGYVPHADLVANVLPGYDMVADTFYGNDGNGRDNDARDPGDGVSAGVCGDQNDDGIPDPETDQRSSWHGTHVAGTIAAVGNNGIGVTGVAYAARIVPVRVLGRCGGYASDTNDGITWATGGSVPGLPLNPNPAKVVNMSLGGIMPTACSPDEQAAINAARARGAVIIVAAGNDEGNANSYAPGNCAGVVNVAAVGRDGGRAWYSNVGSSVDVAAPGGSGENIAANNILSTYNTGQLGPVGDSYNVLAGTSMAAPHVSGVAALMRSVNPSITPDLIERYLRETARTFPASCSGCGTGIVDAYAAVVRASVIVEDYFEQESNNTMATAQLIAAGSGNLNGSIASSTDIDYYKVPLASGKTLTATLTPNTSSDYDLYLYNSSGTLLRKSEKGTGLVDVVSYGNTGTSSATYYVKVIYYRGGTGSTNGRYSLRFAM